MDEYNGKEYVAYCVNHRITMLKTVAENAPEE